MKKKIKLIFLIFLSLSIFIIKKININNENFEKIKSQTNYYPGIVSKVIDGDTIEVFFFDTIPEFCNIEEKIRLIGVDTPEMNIHKKEGPEFYAEEAKNFTTKELLNEKILVKLDEITGLRDKYGRLLGYIYIDDFIFNKIIIEQGYGKYYNKFKFEQEYMNLFYQAQNYAKEKKNGIWNQ